MPEPIKTRWDICEHCIREKSNLSGWHDMLFWTGGALNYIRKNKHRKWYNRFLESIGEDVEELCSNCPFAMEHTILDQELTND